MKSRIEYIEVKSEEPVKEDKRAILLRKYVVIPEKDGQNRIYYRSTAMNSGMHQWFPCVFICGDKMKFDYKNLPEEYDKNKIPTVLKKYGSIGFILKYGAAIKSDLADPIISKSTYLQTSRLATKQAAITSSRLSLIDILPVINDEDSYYA